MRHRKTAGITLIEALVAIAILSIVSALVWGGFAQTTRNKDRVEDDLARYHVVNAALQRMQRELSMAYVSAQVNPSPALINSTTIFAATDRSGGDRLDFTSFSHQRLFRDAHESDQNELSYFVTRHPEDSSIRVLARRESNRIDEDPQKGGRVEILIEDVSDFQLEYLDPLSGEWLNTWDTSQAAGQPNRLPSQVKIFVTVPNARTGRDETFGTRAMLPMGFALNHAIYNP
ncbi:MAG: type II secretion system protein GspJ [Myxococcota bacterium]